MTEHEKMFSDEGIKIKFLIAKKVELKEMPVLKKPKSGKETIDV